MAPLGKCLKILFLITSSERQIAMAMLVALLATLRKILVASTQFLVALASRKGQLWTLKLDPKPKIAAIHATLECHVLMAFLVNG